mgnify:CR=1 FL=1
MPHNIAGNMNKFVVAAAVAAVGFVGAASAADMPVKAPTVAALPVGSGFFFGASIDGIYSHRDNASGPIAVTLLTHNRHEMTLPSDS